MGELLSRVGDRCAIVHGILRLASGERAAHGWFECDACALFDRVLTEPGEDPNPRVVWQCGISGERRLFYACLAEPFYRHVEQYSRYTLRLAARLMAEHGTAGPWRREYRELARHGDAAAGGVRGQLDGQTIVCIVDPVGSTAWFPK